MFTGIIEGFGTLKAISPNGQGKKLVIEADFSLKEVKIGDSIAVNGACLTAVNINQNIFEVDVAPETVSKTSLSMATIGHRLNLERALRFSDRIDGHLVCGHIDGTGVIKSKTVLSNAVVVTVNISNDLSYYMIEKGSVAMDGISLTINSCGGDFFEVSIIPHTAKLTTIGFKKVGDIVNIETDMIGKYVKQFLTKNRGKEENKKKSNIDLNFLVKSGFL